MVEKREYASWTEEDVIKYQEKLEEELENREKKGWKSGTVDEDWKEIKKIVDKAIVKKEVTVKKWRLGMKRWWDKECGKEKRKVKVMYRNWKEEKGSREQYVEERKKWRKLCINKEVCFKEKEEAVLRSLRTEEQVWKFLGRRKQGQKIECNIKSEEWKKSFMDLLEGTEVCQKGEGRKVASVEGEKIGEEEFNNVLRRLKRRKAPGIDGIQNEAWNNSGKLRSKLKGILDRIWKGEEIPEDWKTAVIVPLYKKGEVNNTSNYRGISLLPTAYKIYTEIIRGRLVKELDEKKVLPEGQAGFRKGRSTMDNLFVMKYLVQKAKKDKEKIYATFIDLKKAFDTVNRKKLWECMSRLGISDYLIERIKQLY
ncbi:uncharacterized protein LOC111694680 [Trichogramma pretiosum]|uniref:uncharacterized protein LOC111694680 n=1 Tax=Trichogramma pretiosum TaxID=7493 RepID=UPI000C71B060|nr:uncharacterized protein LOC111694680 [Trichogramma pretiosum]